MHLSKRLWWIASPLAAVALLAVGLPTLVHANATPPTIGTTALPAGDVGVAYSQTLGVSGGTSPYTWSVTSGTLPGGLNLDGTTGVISGTPTTQGTSTFTIQVSDSESPPVTATQDFTLTINNPVSVTTTSLANGEVSLAYTDTLAAANGTTPYSWAVSSGTLPAGLNLDATTGAITGTPTASGTTLFTVKVTDAAGGTDTQDLSITLAPAVSVATTSLPDGTAGTPYAQTLAAADGVSPYTWAITNGALPAGLNLDASTGDISGTPTTAGTANFTVKVLDALNVAATQDLSITVAPAATLTVTTSSLADGSVGTAYNQTLAASGGFQPYTWSVSTGALPAGLNLDPATGLISGTPTAQGTTTFTVTVTDSATPTAATATKDLSITVGSKADALAAKVAAACQDTSVHPALPTLCSLYTGGQLPPFAQGVIGRVILKLANGGHPKGKAHKDQDNDDQGQNASATSQSEHGKGHGKKQETGQSQTKSGLGIFLQSNTQTSGQAGFGFGASGHGRFGREGHGD